MIKITNKINCCGCQACYNACPKHCISMESDEEGFLYPTVDKLLCVNCNKCDLVCPVCNDSQSVSLRLAFAAYNDDIDVRLKSSSGGIFSLIAQAVLKKEGVVFGSGFNDTLDVQHFCITSEKEIRKIRGSKYVQSDIGRSFIMAKEYLEDGKMVLFSGTPCQIEGLLLFLGKNYEKLITQDIVCHGVPSPRIWRIYRQKNKITDFSFRDKTNGWSHYAYRINGKVIEHKNDLFSRAFVYGYSLRPSCYNCKFKKIDRVSDITLGDLWGYTNISSFSNNDTGLSLVVINSPKGKQFFESIECVKELIPLEDAIKYNQSFVASSKMPLDRSDFLYKLTVRNFNHRVKKYTNFTFLYRLRNRIHSFISKKKKEALCNV